MMTRLRSFVQHNLLAKIVALIVAVVLWLYVMNDQNPAIEGAYTVPVTVEQAPDGYKLTSDIDTVTIRVRGPRSFFVAAERGDFHARINLSDFTEGDRAYAVEASIPYGFEVVSISPDRVTVNLDRITQKTFKAEMTLSGTPAAGFTVDKIVQVSETATIEGPRSLVNQVVHIVGHINLTGQSNTYTTEVPLLALNADGREIPGLVLKPASMETSVQLAHGLTRKVVEVQARPRSDLAPNLRLVGVAVEPSRIEIAGAEDVIAKITSIETEEFSLADVQKTEKRQVRLSLPVGVTAADPNVMVEIQVGAM